MYNTITAMPVTSNGACARRC